MLEVLAHARSPPPPDRRPGDRVSLLGIRHGIDWDHIAAITDITEHDRGRERWPRPPTRSSTRRSAATITATAARRDAGPRRRVPARRRWRPRLAHGQRRPLGLRPARTARGRSGSARSTRWVTAPSSSRSGSPPSRSARSLPDWLDPIMGRIVGLTLVGLGLWVLVLRLPLRARRRDVPAAQPLDARLRRRALWLAPLPGAAARPRARRAARDELLRAADRVRRRA